MTATDTYNIGNAAAMRKALEAARDLLLPQCNGGTAFARACGEVVNRVMDALSAPARNCDRFENWADALRVYLAEHPKMADMDQRAIDACCNMWLFNKAKKGESK